MLNRIQKFLLLVVVGMFIVPTTSALTNDIIVYQDDFEQLIFNNQTNLTIPTYDGADQPTHPDVLYFPSGWNGYKYWMAMTPYTNASSNVENPSIVVSNDGITWAVPPGLTNPLDSTPVSGYNSDPDIVYDANGNVTIYYVDRSLGNNYLRSRNTTDGINWNSEYTSLTTHAHELVSPAIIRTGTTYKMWYVNSSNLGSAATSTIVEYRTSTDGLSWTEPTNLTINVTNRIIWHINVNYIPSLNQYWMLIDAGTGTANGLPLELYFGYSTNGINWTVNPGQIIGNGKTKAFDSAQIYRSAMVNIDDSVQLWYGATNTTGVYTNWSIGYVSTNLTELRQPFHWIWRTPSTSDGFYNKSVVQKHSGQSAARIEFISTASDVMKNITSHYNVSGLNTTIQVWMYDDGDLSAMKQLRVRNNSINMGGTVYQESIGVWTDGSAADYTYKQINSGTYTDTGVIRSVGWHLFRMDFWKDKHVDYYIDSVKVGTEVNQFDDVLQIVFPTLTYPTETYFDDMKVTYNNSANDTGIYTGNITNVITTSGFISYTRERYPTETPINVTVLPSSDTVNVTISTWSVGGDYYKAWSEGSTVPGITTTNVVGDLPANTPIKIKKNGVVVASGITNSTGYITFTSSTGGSPTFEVSLSTQEEIALQTGWCNSGNSSLNGAFLVGTILAFVVGAVLLFTGINNIDIKFAVAGVLVIIGTVITLVLGNVITSRMLVCG